MATMITRKRQKAILYIHCLCYYLMSLLVAQTMGRQMVRLFMTGKLQTWRKGVVANYFSLTY